MPGTRCAVATCNNNLLRTKKGDLNISYHKFPRDSELFNVWINACHRKDKWNPKTSVICSQHFEEDDFEVNLKSQLMNIKTKRKLKCSAVPCLFLKPSEYPQSENGAILRKKKLQDCIEQINQRNIKVPRLVKESLMKEKIRRLREQHHQLEDEYRMLQQLFKEQNEELLEAESRLKDVTRQLESERCNIDRSQRKLIVGKRKHVE